MCRMAAYLGPPVPLAALLAEPPNALQAQAWRPRRQLRGTVNVDGTAVVWWPPGEREPLRYATELPPWSDPNLLPLAARLTGEVQLAAVRDATPGLPYGAAAVAPFAYGGIAFAHNGRVGGFRGATARALLARLPDDLLGALPALTDSAVLFAQLLRHCRASDAAGLAGALAATVREAEKACAGLGETATLTLLAAEAGRVAGVRAALGAPSDALYVLDHGARWPESTLVASEPLDDDRGWAELPDRHLIELTRDGARVTPLDGHHDKDA